MANEVKETKVMAKTPQELEIEASNKVDAICLKELDAVLTKYNRQIGITGLNQVRATIIKK